MAILLYKVLDLILVLYLAVLFFRALLSWVQFPPYHPVARHLLPPMYAITEPLLLPIRRWLAPYQRNSPVDFSVAILMVAVMVVRNLLVRVLYMGLG
ncbi:MAG TPA: YggT family protein [Armatimonadetes bacterium]|jgi:uncharacterized protein YggT (Ycf19 family)|nr:YggT family protein [Armatimonadota bacterium]